jgi:hypothetical protein
MGEPEMEWSSQDLSLMSRFESRATVYGRVGSGPLGNPTPSPPPPAVPLTSACATRHSRPSKRSESRPGSGSLGFIPFQARTPCDTHAHTHSSLSPSHTRARARTDTHMHAGAHKHARTHTHTRRHTHTHTHGHTHMRTHTFTPASLCTCAQGAWKEGPVAWQGPPSHPLPHASVHTSVCTCRRGGIEGGRGPAPPSSTELHPRGYTRAGRPAAPHPPLHPLQAVHGAGASARLREHQV